MTVSRAIGLQQSSLGNIGTVGNIIWLQQPGMGSISIIACHAAWCCAHGHSANSLWHTCLLQGAMLRGPWPKIFSTLACHKVAMPRGPWPKIFSTLACHKVPCQGGLGQKSSAHLPAADHHAEGASAKNLWHTCLPQVTMPRGPQPKIFGTLACCRVPCQEDLGQTSLAHLPAAGCHAEGASAKNLWHTCLLQVAMPRGPWPKIFSTLACHRLPCEGGLGQKSLAHLPAAGCHAEGASAKNL